MNNLKIKGSKNIRDLSTINSNNVKIKDNMIYRGSALDLLTKKDVKILKEKYKISTIIDLRTEMEIMKRPDVIISDVENIHMPMFNKKIPGITHEGRKELETEINVDMSKMYREIITKDEYLKKVSEIIKKIINLKDEEYPVIFHCTEGKDRTGIITVILYLILGVEKEKIIEDYLYTNKVNKKKANFFYFISRWIKGNNKKKAEIIKNMYLAKEEYIEEIFYVIEEEYKGIDSFLKKGLKITGKEIEKFKKKIVMKEGV